MTAAIHARYPELRVHGSHPFKSKANAGEPESCDVELANVENFENTVQRLANESFPKLKKGAKPVVWQKIFCHQPFVNLAAGHYRVSFCCFASKEFRQINYDDDSLTILDLWNHPKVVEARRLMYEGRADLICREICPHLAGGGLKHNDLR